MKNNQIIISTLAMIVLLSGCVSTNQPPTHSSNATNTYAIEKSIYPLHDEAITSKVTVALVRENVIETAKNAPIHINVMTVNGIVYLSGAANNQDEIYHAIRIARAIQGVRGVRTSIIIIK